MATTPPARPSSPSTKFTALTVATTSRPVSSALWTGSRAKTRSSVQVKKKNWMPEAMSRAAART